MKEDKIKLRHTSDLVVYFTLFIHWTSITRQRLRCTFLFHGMTAPSGPGPPHCRAFTPTLIHTTLSRTPLDEWSARRRDLYLTKHNTHKRQTSMLSAGFEPAIPERERPQTHSLHRAATGIRERPSTFLNFVIFLTIFVTSIRIFIRLRYVQWKLLTLLGQLKHTCYVICHYNEHLVTLYYIYRAFQ
jgi:hypothetical protein